MKNLINKRYISYSEIPGNVIEFICNVAGISTIFELSISEINDFLVDLDEYYESQGSKMQDFIC